MEKQEEKKGKKTFKTLLLIAGTVAICYEAFARKGKDVKQACNWVKSKIQSKPTQVEVENQNRQRNDWNNKRKN